MKNKLIILAIVLLAIQMPSCKKTLDLEPISVATDKGFWKNGTEADASVAATYALLRKAFNSASGTNYFAYGDFCTPEFLPYLYNEDWGPISEMRLDIPFPISADYRNIIRMRRFDYFYRVIDQANRCLKFIPNIPVKEFTDGEAGRNKLLGEAYFMRAFTYFYISRIWGDVPLVIETTENPANSQELSRAPAKDVLAQCVKDVEAALPLMQFGDTNPNNRAVRANKGSAYALLAHIYAWQQKYPECAVAADQVIQNGGYSLVDSTQYLNIYKGKSSEGIFEIAESGDNENPGVGSFFWGTLKSPYIPNVSFVSYRLDDLFLKQLFAEDPNDIRLTKGFDFLGTPEPICIKYANVKSNGDPSNYVFKNNIIVFRLADIILLKAEALAAEGNNTEARTVLNNLRDKRGAKNTLATDANLFEEVIFERGRELFMEGHFYYDLVRLAKEKKIYKFNNPLIYLPQRMSGPEFEAGKYLWPIDPYLITKNRKLVQTPFWQGRL